MSIISQIFGSNPAGQVQNVNSTQAVQPATDQRGAEYLKNRAAGSTVEGKITDIKGNEVQIELSNGGRVSAQLESAMNLSEGQMLAFEIRANSGSQISLTPLYTNLAMGHTATNALNAAGMVVSADTLSMTMSMMDSGMSIDNKSLGDMYHLISQFPDADIKNLVEMKSLGLPIDQQNINQYEAFKNYEGQIQEGFKDTAESAMQLYDELMNEGDGAEGMNFISKFTDIITKDIPDEALNGTLKEDAVITGKNAGIPLAEKSADATALETDKAAVQGETGDKAAVSDAAAQPGTAFAEVRTQLSAELDGILAKVSEEKAAEEKLPAEKAESETVIKEQAEQAAKNGKTPADNPEAVKDPAAQLKNDLVQLLKDNGASEKLINDIKTMQDDPKAVVKLVNDILNKTAEGNTKNGQFEAELKELIRSDAFKESVKTVMKDNWTLRPEQVADKSNVEQLYQKLGTQTRDMLDLLTQIAKPESAMAQNLSDMGNNLDFMNQMNQAMQYVQLPLKMNGSDATGDLYVYSDRKSLANKDGNVSAFLHLDMTHLGTVDVYAAISNGNKVSTKFYLESDEMIDFIAANIHLLDERLQERGYSINSEVKKHSDADDKSKTVRSLTDTEMAAPIYTSSFDLRA
ncbi:MAG: flagellar hook-length control protein FliK [Lachnospiraceae bacterium]|nr:flagellar hook-length control protein FliK [Lachnospiraceae bacterium]